MMVCHSQHLTGIMITGQETVLSTTVQDGGTISATVQFSTNHMTTMVTLQNGTHSPPTSSVVK